MDPAFRRASVYFDDIEYQRRFEQNLIRYDLIGRAEAKREIKNIVLTGGGGGNGHAFCYWTLEGSNIVRYGGNVGVGIHPHSNDFEVRGNVLVEAIAEQPYVEIRNWSDTEYDPVIHWSLGATSVKKYTMGVDDSDSDAWLLCSGDILTSVEAAATYTMEINYDGFLFVLDTLNDRLKKHLSADAMTYVSKIGSTGTGDDNFATPQAICNDGIYLYICDRQNHRIVKRKASDLSYVTEIGSVGTGDDQFNQPWGICTDGTHVYITDSGNNRIKKHFCSDLSYVASATVADSDPLDPHDFNDPKAICTDGTYLYITQNSGATCRLITLFCSTLSDVLQIHDDGYIDSCGLLGICVTGGYLYILNQNDPASLKHVYKYSASSLTYVTHWGVFGTGDGEMTQALAIDTDGTTLWIFDYATIPDANRLMKFLLDGTYVATYGHYGTTEDDEFYYACGLSLGGSISFSSTIYRAPILKAGLDGSYCDSYPLLRARDGFHLMEDGTEAATKYVGLYAPAAITASYGLTFPGTGPAAAGHFAVDAAGLITWGQDLITTASPTFVGLTLSGLTASHPVFTDAGSALVSTGTVPVDHGGTGLAVYAIGDLIYASATTTLARRADVAVASYLRSGGIGVAPLWSTLKLPNAATAFRLPVATSANTIGEVAAVGATGEYLKGNTGAIPSWATLNQAAVAGLTTASSPSFVALTLTIADGTAPMTITSTTMVANLNADLLDGYHYASFAPATHYHDSDYISIIVTPAANHFPYQTAGGELIDSTYDAADFAAAAHAHVQADITGLHTDDNVTFGSIYLGIDDTARGVAHIYGPGTGYVYGGSVYLYLGADYDTSIAEYGIVAWEDDLLIGPNTDRDALKLDSNKDFYVTAGSLVLPTSEYLNFGGVLGAGSYGLRDNGGVIEIKNSGGAWTTLLSDWGVTSWPHRKRIDLPVPTANLTDFPVEVPIIADAEIGATCRADGFDIRFTASDGTTLLDYERESFAVAGGEASGIFWVKSDVAAAGTYIWCYYGNPAAADVSTAVGTQWTTSGNCTVTGKTKVEKTGGVDASWDAQAYSVEGYVDTCALYFRAGQADKNVMIGLNSDPATDASYSSIDYAAWAWSTGVLGIWESNVQIGSFDAYTVNSIFRIIYDGVNVKYYLDDVLQRTVARAVGAALYVDSSFAATGAIIEHIAFGPTVDWVEFAYYNQIAADGRLTWGAEETSLQPLGPGDGPTFDHIHTSQIETNATAPTDLTIITGAAKTLVLATPVYKDINIAGYLLTKPASSYPGVDTFRSAGGVDTTIETYAFALNEMVHGGFELQHDYKEGTDLVFHIHWQGIAAPDGGTDNVQWRLNYIVARDGVTLAAATAIDSPDVAIDTQYRCYRTDFAAIVGTTFKICDQFMFTLTRVAAESDDYAGECLIETAGIHYQVDTLGSRTITAK